MSFKEYIKEMKRLGWSEEELKEDYRLHKETKDKGIELPWFPYQKEKEKTERI